ncbi:hypothetical protein [Streptomyces sp. NPDC047453]|uniref:hypothetical protein n=1 Tax=Streptomyces sp. NPDC047453 TaxID=3154812 RepID=UPI0033C1C36C
MASAGVTEEELAEELARFREVWLDPRSASSELGEAAACLLLGVDYQDAPTRLDALAKVTPEQARQAFTSALATALLVVPCHVEAARRRLSHPGDLLHHACVPAGRRVFKPSLFKRTVLAQGWDRLARVIPHLRTPSCGRTATLLARCRRLAESSTQRKGGRRTDAPR